MQTLLLSQHVVSMRSHCTYLSPKDTLAVRILRRSAHLEFLCPHEWCIYNGAKVNVNAEEPTGWQYTVEIYCAVVKKSVKRLIQNNILFQEQ